MRLHHETMQCRTPFPLTARRHAKHFRWGQISQMLRVDGLKVFRQQADLLGAPRHARRRAPHYSQITTCQLGDARQGLHPCHVTGKAAHHDAPLASLYDLTQTGRNLTLGRRIPRAQRVSGIADHRVNSLITQLAKSL